MFDLSQKTALITGAGQGVGAGIAQALAQQGAAVAVNDIVADRAEAVAETIRQQGGRAQAVPFDVTDPDAAVAAVAGIAQQSDSAQLSGPVSILVNNAGNAGANDFVPTSFSELDPSQWQKFIDINLFGVMNCTKAVLGDMIGRGWGRIITISSGAGLTGLTLGVSVYGAGKGAAISFMRHIAIENARHNITANSLALGLMDNVGDGGATAALAKAVPVGRLGTPADVGAACVWLASEEAAWVTGQTINVNGGSLLS